MGVAWNLSTCVIRASGAGVLQVVPSRPSPSSTSTEVLGVGLAGRHVTLVLVLIMWSTMSCNCYYRLIFAENRWCGDIWRAHGTPTPPRPARGPASHSVLCLPLLQARSLLITFTTCSSYTCWCWYLMWFQLLLKVKLFCLCCKREIFMWILRLWYIFYLFHVGNWSSLQSFQDAWKVK